MMCIKGLVYRLSHDCRFDVDRGSPTTHCRFSSDDNVDLSSRTICANVVVGETGQYPLSGTKLSSLTEALNGTLVEF